MRKIIVAAFYKYINIEKPLEFVKKHLDFCKKLGIRGRILIAKEGINGSISGTKRQIEKYKSEMRKDEKFIGMEFKEDSALMHPFNKTRVKVKEEIVRFGQKVDLQNTGKHISAKEFLKLYQTNGKIGKNIIILDARNDYESRVGKFKNALTSKIKNFREFPKVAEMLNGKEDKKIVMYCTGGIRCEKASAYLKEQGFKDVCQLNGGILSFGKKFPDSVWEGKCFVFDKRLLASVNKDENPITKCEICDIKCDLYKNCANKECDKFCVVCLDCEKRFGGCCSKECFEKMQERRNFKNVKNNIEKEYIIETLL